MLTDIEKQEIDAERKHYAFTRAVVPEALKVVQKHRGWVSDEGVYDIAEYLRMSPHEIDAVATFYNLIFRRQVGRHVILICDSVSCWITGYHDVLAMLRERLGIELGQTTADDRFTLLPIACLGACEVAPAMMVDDDLHGNLTPARVDEILGRYP